MCGGCWIESVLDRCWDEWEEYRFECFVHFVVEVRGYVIVHVFGVVVILSAIVTVEPPVEIFVPRCIVRVDAGS